MALFFQKVCLAEECKGFYKQALWNFAYVLIINGLLKKSIEKKENVFFHLL